MCKYIYIYTYIYIYIYIYVYIYINNIYIYTWCEITFGHRTCPTNLAQCPIEKQFLFLNLRTMSVKNLFVVKPLWLNRNRVTKILLGYSFFYKVIIQHH